MINFYNSVSPENLLALITKKISITMRPQTYIESETCSYVSADANATKHKGAISSNVDYISLLDGLMGAILASFSHYFYLTNFVTVE